MERHLASMSSCAFVHALALLGMSPPKVLGLRHGFKVPRIHTHTPPAEMVEDESSGHFLTEDSVGGNVSADISPMAPGANDAVAFLITGSEPDPTSGVRLRRHLCHQPILQGFEGRSEERRVGKECRSRWSPY